MTAVFAMVLIAADVGIVPEADVRPNVAGVSAGLDGTSMTLSIVGGRAIRRWRRRAVMVSGAFDLPMAQPDFGDWRLRAGVRLDAFRWKGLAIPVRLDGSVRMLSNRSVRMVGLGTELSAAPGWYAKRWFAAAEVAWDQSWTTRLDHTDAYRDVVYEDVQDGWLRLGGFTMRYGARVGGLVLPSLELWVRAGYEQHGRFDTVAPPLYAVVGSTFRF